jgi:hypothetical protein
MPCNDGPPPFKMRQIIGELNNEIENAQYQKNKIDAEKKQLEAVLCALCSELDRRGIAVEVIAAATHNGLIDLLAFWQEHKKDDASRLANDINKRYSKDELAVIKTILGE